MSGPPLTLSARSGIRTCAAVAIIIAYYLFRFHDSLLTFFALDDYWILEAAARVGRSNEPWRLLLPGQGAFVLYRPLTQVGYFALLRLLFDHDASGYHAVQLAVHVCNALLVFGIVRRLTGSHLGALAAGLFYAAAPGHMVAIYWLAAYAMTGSTLVVLAAVYLWVRTRGGVRIVGCTLLQAVGLLSSEHTVVIPALLAIVSVLGPARERPLRVARQIVGPTVLVAAYMAAKVWYLAFSPALNRFSGYAVDGDVARWLSHLGRYTAACVNVLAVQQLSDRSWMLVGIAVVAITLASAWRTLSGDDRWQLLAVGSATLVICLLPVLPLRDHYYDYYVGTAALGMALALLGACRLITAAWAPLAASCVALLLVFDVVTGAAASRRNPVYVLVQGSAAGSAGWVRAVQRVVAGGATDVVVPRNVLTVQVFEVGRSHELFPPSPQRLTLRESDAPSTTPGAVTFRATPPPVDLGDALPGWQPRLAPLRRLAGAKG